MMSRLKFGKKRSLLQSQHLTEET